MVHNPVQCQVVSNWTLSYRGIKRHQPIGHNLRLPMIWPCARFEMTREYFITNCVGYRNRNRNRFRFWFWQGQRGKWNIEKPFVIMGEKTTTKGGRKNTYSGSTIHHDRYTAPDTMHGSTHGSSQLTTCDVLGLAWGREELEKRWLFATVWHSWCSFGASGYI